MAKIYNNISDLVGGTPLLRLSNIEKKHGLNATILAKLEAYNPAGSVKDRIAKNMLDDAEKSGALKPGATIIEPTSGNTGIGLASQAAARGYKVILTMPESMSIERRKLIAAYGAEIVLTEAAKGMKGALDKADELAKETPDSFIPKQFFNPANPETHYNTTGPEIWNDTAGNVDVLVAGVGTGGTITGAGKYLKDQNAAIEIVAVEPAASPLLNGGAPAGHAIQGIGANFIPETLDTDIYDKVIDVEASDAFAATKELAKAEGFLAGISSGAALYAAIELAKQDSYKGKTIVVVLPDTGERYLSTPLFE